ncbi:MAG: 23S rRNA (guanosine(2251)-2'-O)-methyltransferase RlmB [Proteobacteria bacterium]|nr:MAG: 23S rRNA (guanosine(2251)-2'-O)-methyltransferase RlmB [Pseudomonadota bacterium]
MIVYGKQLFLHVLEKMPQIIEKIYLAKECDKKLFNKIKSLNKEILRPDFKKAQALAKGGNHQGFLLEIKPLEFARLDDVKSEDFLLVLYGLSDVGNIGAICRSAYAFGVGAVIIAGVKSINLEGILRTSSGAIFDLPIVLKKDGLSLLNELKQSGFYIYASHMDGLDIRKAKIKDKKVLIMGSEGFGIPKKVLAKSDEVVKIKMVREFDSLNVSVATAIMCDRMVNG